MTVLILSMILMLLSVKLNKHIKKHQNLLYVILTMAAAATYLFDGTHNIIGSGEIGTAFFIVVMFQGALSKKFNITQKLLLTRKEYSILGFIALIPHGLFYLISRQVFEWNGIVSLAIMLPLFITSFIVVRRKIKPHHWSLLHAYSYIVYSLIFAHLIIMSHGVNTYAYTLIFITYIILKIKNHPFKKLNTNFKRITVIGVIILIVILNVSVPSKPVLAEKNDILSFDAITFKDGVYNGTAKGFKNLEVVVNVTVHEGTVTDIQIVSYGGTHPEKGMNFEAAVHEVKNTILKENSTDVDTISGATYSTAGMINAVNNALHKAIE